MTTEQASCATAKKKIKLGSYMQSCDMIVVMINSRANKIQVHLLTSIAALWADSWPCSCQKCWNEWAGGAILCQLLIPRDAFLMLMTLMIQGFRTWLLHIFSVIAICSVIWLSGEPCITSRQDRTTYLPRIMWHSAQVFSPCPLQEIMSTWQTWFLLTLEFIKTWGC